MPVHFETRASPAGKSPGPPDGATHDPSALSPSVRNALLSDDIVYCILIAATNGITSDLDRRETLFAFCHVCHAWSRAAQSLLFRHIFLQIRSSMMALLNVIDHKTERGRRLAGYIQSATIKMSKQPEEFDPPTLPMIHIRHLPALLCHMPNLSTLDLTLGAESLAPEILSAFARGPCITTLYIKRGRESDTEFLANGTNPWPHLEAVTIKSSGTAYIPGHCGAPGIRLTQVAVHYTSGGGFNEIPWLTSHSKETLSHVSLISEGEVSSHGVLRKSQFRNVQSLTLGRIIWDELLSETLHTFTCLKELRFASFIRLEHSFPSNLPDTIQHLLITTPFLPTMSSKTVNLDMTRPALLKSLIVVDTYWPGYVTAQDWAKGYIQVCETDGISTNITRQNRSISDEWLKNTSISFKAMESKIPIRIRQSDARFQPTASQLDLTNFEVIIGGKNSANKLNGPFRPRPSSQSTMHESFRNACLSPSGRNVLFSDDIVYSILIAATNSATSDLDRRGILFACCHVCHVWSRAAQSLLFRHVFLQIRSSMMALLKIIDHKTERGRRLAGYIQSATIKLSKQPEEFDPPTLPMIHVRHVPALLCHMPNLCTLDLTLGGGSLTPNIISAFARGPRITNLRIEGGYDIEFLANETNPWPHLETITIKSPGTAAIHESRNAPRIRLAQITIHYTYAGSFTEVPWLIGHSKETLSHVSLVSQGEGSSYSVLHQSQFRNIRSLTLGHITWDERLSGTLHTFACLKELRFASFIRLAHSFPSNLPDTIEHLLVTSPFMPSTDQKSVDLDMTRPALLKSLVVIDTHSSGYVFSQTWVKDYIQVCETDGILTEIIRPNRSVSDKWLGNAPIFIKEAESKIPMRIRRSDGRFQPTPSQLDLTAFEVILGAKSSATKSKPHSGSRTSSWATMHDNFRTVYWNIRDLISGWTNTN